MLPEAIMNHNIFAQKKFKRYLTGDILVQEI